MALLPASMHTAGKVLVARRRLTNRQDITANNVGCHLQLSIVVYHKRTTNTSGWVCTLPVMLAAFLIIINPCKPYLSASATAPHPLLAAFLLWM
jgi:hypothetical protein